MFCKARVRIFLKRRTCRAGRRAQQSCVRKGAAFRRQPPSTVRTGRQKSP